MDHIQRFLLEMGAGFAFVGRQVLIEVGDSDFRVDLLFYHLQLRRYVVVAPGEEDEDFDFKETLLEIHVELEGLNADAAELAANITRNLEVLVA